MSVAVRVIPCLDVDRGRVVKGVNFTNLVDAGDPVELARAYDAEGADELTFLDVTASSGDRETTFDVVRRTAEQVFIPLTVGGGVRSPEDVNKLLRAGADKVSLNTAAIARPELLREASQRFGAQCIVLSVDARRIPEPPPTGFEVTTHGGRTGTGIDAVEWAARGQELGVGEILLNSMDADGTKAGFDIELIELVRARGGRAVDRQRRRRRHRPLPARRRRRRGRGARRQRVPLRTAPHQRGQGRPAPGRRGGAVTTPTPRKRSAEVLVSSAVAFGGALVFFVVGLVLWRTSGDADVLKLPSFVALVELPIAAGLLLGLRPVHYPAMVVFVLVALLHLVIVLADGPVWARVAPACCPPCTSTAWSCSTPDPRVNTWEDPVEHPARPGDLGQAQAHPGRTRLRGGTAARHR